jgi:hypothetical protein
VLFGGIKHSGVGREFGTFGIKAFLEPGAIQASGAGGRFASPFHPQLGDRGGHRIHARLRSEQPCAWRSAPLAHCTAGWVQAGSMPVRVIEADAVHCRSKMREDRLLRDARALDSRARAWSGTGLPLLATQAASAVLAKPPVPQDIA